MTRNNIIVSALSQLGRGQDTQSIDTFADRLTGYANDAIYDLATAYKPVRTDVVAVTGGVIKLSDLSRGCLKIARVTQEGKEVPYKAGTNPKEMLVGAEGEVSVTYRFAPAALKSTTDEPELPEHMHGLIVHYVVARERAASDAGNQRGANIYFELYEAGKRSIRPHVGEPSVYSIVNRWD